MATMIPTFSSESGRNNGREYIAKVELENQAKCFESSRQPPFSTYEGKLEAIIQQFLEPETTAEQDAYRSMTKSELNEELTILNVIEQLAWKLPSSKKFQSVQTSADLVSRCPHDSKTHRTMTTKIPPQYKKSSFCSIIEGGDLTTRKIKLGSEPLRRGKDPVIYGSTWIELNEREFWTDRGKRIVRDLKDIANLLNELMMYSRQQDDVY